MSGRKENSSKSKRAREAEPPATSPPQSPPLAQIPPSRLVRRLPHNYGEGPAQMSLQNTTTEMASPSDANFAQLQLE